MKKIYLIYILDQDYIDKDKKFKFKKDGFEIRIFNKRTNLIDRVKKKVPDLVLFDLYSKQSDDSNSAKTNSSVSNPSVNSQVDSVENNVSSLSTDSQAESKDDVEKALTNMQLYRDKAREKINKEYYLSGIEDVEFFLESPKISISFPIAMFTRYGRQLLSAENILMLQKEGIYFVWKNKSDHSEGRYKDGFSERERKSIEKVMQSYSISVARISPDFERFRKDFNNNHNRYQFAKSVIGYAEGFFLFIVILSCLFNLEPFLAKPHSGIVIYLYELFSVPWVSIGMLVVTLVYIVLKFAYRYSNIKLDEVYEQANTLLKDLIKSRGKSS